MLGESHALNIEFPDKSETINTLNQDNSRFKDLASEYHQLDDEIRGLELQESPISDVEAKKLKSHRAYLKDTLYEMICLSENKPA